MDKVKNLEQLAETVQRLSDALEALRKGEDPQLLLVDALGPLQLHLQREALRNAKSGNARNGQKYSSEQIDEAIALIDLWLKRLVSDNAVEAYEASEMFRMHYSPIRLLKMLQSMKRQRREGG